AGSSRVGGGLRRGRQGDSPGATVITFECPVVASKEDELVLFDWAAECAAKVVQTAVALFWAVGLSLKELPRPETLILVVLKQHAVELIRPGFGDHCDGCAAGHALLRVEIVRGNIDFLNG